MAMMNFFFFSSRRRHTRSLRDWSSDVCSSDLEPVDLEQADGFISLERFESITTAGKFVSLQFWRDEEAVRKWRNLQKHRAAQAKGRAGIFASYRLRIAQVL